MIVSVAVRSPSSASVKSATYAVIDVGSSVAASPPTDWFQKAAGLSRAITSTPKPTAYPTTCFMLRSLGVPEVSPVA